MTSSIGIMTSQPLFQNTITLRRPGIIKIITRFIKKILKDSRKVKRIRNYVSKSNLKICWLLVKKCLCQQNPRVCVTGFIYFLNLLLCQVSSLYDMCDSFYGRGIFCPQPPPPPPIYEPPWKCPSWIGLRKFFMAKLGRETYESHVDRGLHECSDQKH